MAAMDMFNNLKSELSEKEREAAAALLARYQRDLFSARSEDARLRIVDECLLEVKALTRRS